MKFRPTYGEFINEHINESKLNVDQLRKEFDFLEDDEFFRERIGRRHRMFWTGTIEDLFKDYEKKADAKILAEIDKMIEPYRKYL
jgi:hypothetical protein